MLSILIKNVALWTLSTFIFFEACKFSHSSQDDNMNQMLKVEYPEYVTKDYVMGHFDPEDHKMFSIVDRKYADREGMYLHKETLDAFIKMWESAKDSGIDLQIRSAMRNFDYQKGIWERKWNGSSQLSDGTLANEIEDIETRARKILLYSSMPGTSRHHWGTDIDLNSFDNEYFETGVGVKEYEWLVNNAGNFGFCQPYSSKENGRTGYEQENWHWTYLPLSTIFLNYYRENVINADISGFAGSNLADPINMLDNFVMGISTECLAND